MAKLIETFNFVFSEDTADSRTYKWPLISGPWKIPGILICYVCCIYIILPTYMRNRKPYNLKYMVMTYNVFQIIACSLLAYKVATSGWTTHYTLGCQSADDFNDEMAAQMATYVWWHMVVKLTDLIETAFYVLRKKFDQVSPLHVYHHIFVVCMGWITCKYSPGGMVTFTIPVNSSIHVLMYFYYLLASCGPEMQRKLKVFKPKLTAFQIIQLTVLVIHSLQALLPNCHLKPQIKGLYFIYVTNMTIMLFLFLKFYFANFAKGNKNI